MYYKEATVARSESSEDGAVLVADSTNDTFTVRDVLVANIRPEDGLARKRDRDGHLELQRSIQQFGVLTPITVRPAPDGSGDFLLIKGQGRTLACRLLGLPTIPAVVVDDAFADNEKVRQFLAENVARLKMRPVDRALLVHRARQNGEETIDVARRFGLTPATVRRLYSQLDGATQTEVSALRSGDVNLGLHAVVARHVKPVERSEVISTLGHTSVRAKELETFFIAVGWRRLADLGDDVRPQRLALLAWACSTLDALTRGTAKDRLRQVASLLPTELEQGETELMAAAR